MQSLVKSNVISRKDKAMHVMEEYERTLNAGPQEQEVTFQSAITITIRRIILHYLWRIHSREFTSQGRAAASRSYSSSRARTTPRSHSSSCNTQRRIQPW